MKTGAMQDYEDLVLPHFIKGVSMGKSECVRRIADIVQGNAVGDTIVIPTDTNGIVCHVKLKTGIVAERYYRVELSILNVKEQTSVCSTEFNLEDNRYNVHDEYKSNPKIGGGYFWTYDGTWYNYVPDLNVLRDDIETFIHCHGLTRKLPF